MSELDTVREEMVALWEQMAPYWGMTSEAAQIQAWLLGHDRAADASRIAAGLELDLDVVERGLDELRQSKLVRAERLPGASETTYRAETDVEKLMRAIIENRRRHEWEPLLRHIDQWNGQLEREPTAAAHALRERLARFRALMGFADSMAASVLEGGTFKSLGLKLLLKQALRKK